MNKENRLSKKIISVLMCIAIVFSIAVPLYMNVFSENAQQGDKPDIEGLEMSKSYDPVNKTLTLETYVTGESVITDYTKVSTSVDFVLVLDNTSSMKTNSCKIVNNASQLDTLSKTYVDSYKYNGSYSMRWNNGWEYKKLGSWKKLVFGEEDYISATRIVALKVAVEDFINRVAEISKNNIDLKKENILRIGIVKFGSNVVGTDLSEVLNNLTDCSSEESVSSLLASVEGLNAKHASTNPRDGIELGASLFENSKSTTKKVMVVFTDGDPNSGGGVKGAVEEAVKVKEYATVYTVGVFDNKTTTDPSQSSTELSDEDKDKFMNAMSSGYPDAYYKNGVKLGDPNPDEKQYYYRMKDDSKINLSEIFTIIADQASSGGDVFKEALNDKTTLHDVISEEFTIDDESDGIHVYIQEYKGNNQWGTRTELKQGTKAEADEDDFVVYVDNSDPAVVDVSGFNYSKYWCGPVNSGGTVTYKGYKLVVTIPIKPVDGVAGGTGVNTNGENSGIIWPNDTEPREKFDPPKTDITTDVVVKKVFAGNTPQSAKFTVDIKASAHIKPGEFVDVDGYQQSKTEEKDYTGIVFDKNHLTYDGVKGLLVAGEGRESKVYVKEKAVPVGYMVTIADNKGHSYDFTANGGDIEQAFDVVDGLEITITNNKTTANNATVTLINHVSGNMTNVGDTFTVGGTYKSGGKDATLTGKLKDGDKQVVENVDFDSTFMFYESMPVGYSSGNASTEVKVNGETVSPNQNGIYIIEITEDTVIEFNNVNHLSVNEGVILEFAPYILILILVLAGIAVVIIKKKKTEID